MKRRQLTKNHFLFAAAESYCKQKGFPLPQGGDNELLFAKELGRKFAFDCAWIEQKIAFEFQGGGGKGRHLRFSGYAADCVKMAYAVGMGWRLYYITTQQAAKGMHYLLMDYEFGHKDLTLLGAGLDALSSLYKPRKAAGLSRRVPRRRAVERGKARGKS